MLPVSLTNALKEYALAQKSSLPAGTTEAVAKTTAKFDLGQTLQGKVQANVAANIFKVNVSGKLVQMELPASIRSGDTVSLQVVALQPKLTFSMVNSENPLSTPEQLGATARLLSSMSQQAPRKAVVRAAQTTPLWQAAGVPDSKQLVGQLREALSNSGLFYESHQAQWIGGERSTAQLMHEPQNLTAQQAKAVADLATNAADQSAKSLLTMANDKANPAAVSRTADAGLTSSLSLSAQADGKAPSIPNHLQPLVQQQLNALETKQMQWQGNVWQGQEMHWEVHEQTPQSSAEIGQQQWVTQIKLDLPKLGEVSATLRFNSAGLSLLLNTDTAQARSKLGSASSRLVSALADAGIPVLNTQITNE